ncbi:hypothetical protein H310_13928 [Aphanomyces invadans]|uniref:Uncharacterized protein n=1 Tax=Aphanomyces invadans TaxID=157072 RepID=A0A024TBK7_9STRA|nr:hypothetical protein H310_13928 [Aphanomyces invadans]ETV91545.1 hypothetical protein H310_13928 [Aphanomyces invadans]|eukprot:XP_008879813.1 hypothetical protein H310_13928 [Aphanomyces invadans]
MDNLELYQAAVDPQAYLLDTAGTQGTPQADHCKFFTSDLGNESHNELFNVVHVDEKWKCLQDVNSKESRTSPR